MTIEEIVKLIQLAKNEANNNDDLWRYQQDLLLNLAKAIEQLLLPTGWIIEK
jgi:hypothetical protein